MQDSGDPSALSWFNHLMAHISTVPLKGWQDFVKDHGDLYLDSPFGIEQETPLIAAVINFRHDLAEFLLLHKADYGCRDRLGAAALDWALCQRDLDAVCMLLKNGADPNARFGKYPNALHYAAHNIRPVEEKAWDRVDAPIMERLLACGADVKARDEAGRTAADVVAAKDRTDLVRLIRRFEVAQDRVLSKKILREGFPHPLKLPPPGKIKPRPPK